MFKAMHGFNNRIRKLEEKLASMGADTRSVVQSEIKKRWVISPETDAYFGLFTAMCVDTLDRHKQNRVRFFSPLFHNPDVVYSSLDWAYPINPMGGFDDMGLNWVPPAGSLLCIIFERGDRNKPFYLGTTWVRSRGSKGEYLKFYDDLQEYWKIHNTHRKGYLVGENDESQVFPPWNTDNYQGFDVDSGNEKEDIINAQIKVMTYPHIYGFKTPQKHMLKMDDGDYKCHHRWKRMELQSSCGNYMILKDDHLHAACQWAHPKCSCDSPSSIESPCHETWVSGGQTLGFKPLEEPPGAPTACGKSWYKPQCANKYFKHENECRPCKGPKTPQNNNISNEKYGLAQSGIAILSISGHYFGMDDKVEQPRGRPEWERSTKNFDYGCTDKYEGKTWWKSSTGHCIEMNDYENPKRVRGWSNWWQGNYIRMLTACGNMVELNDHTTPECTAGNKRGIVIRSTSKHTIKMMDEGNTQCASNRCEIGGAKSPTDPEQRPKANAKRGFIQIRSGYGLEMMFRDDDQQQTQSQYIQIMAPQKDNGERGPHIMRFQERSGGPGYVFLKVGGNYLIYTYDNHYGIVGSSSKPANKVTIVSKHTLMLAKKYYINIADAHMFIAQRRIFLLAGSDCEGGGPCPGQALVLVNGKIRYSDRVFVSASSNSPIASIFHMSPFAQQ